MKSKSRFESVFGRQVIAGQRPLSVAEGYFGGALSVRPATPECLWALGQYPRGKSTWRTTSSGEAQAVPVIPVREGW